MCKEYDSLIIEKDASKAENMASSLSDIGTAYTTDNFVDALEYIIANNIKLVFCITRYTMSFEERIISFIDKVNEVNSIIINVVIDCPADWIENRKDLISKYNLILLPENSTESEINDAIRNKMYSNNTESKRQFSRVDWPLNVNISENRDFKKQITRNVLSISGNGAYISSENFMPQKDDMLTLTISFKDFKLFTEAKVVWLNNNKQKPNLPEGFAVTFIDTSLASQKVIDDIIKDKIIKRVLFDFKAGN